MDVNASGIRTLDYVRIQKITITDKPQIGEESYLDGRSFYYQSHSFLFILLSFGAFVSLHSNPFEIVFWR